ncbi:DUF3472 domain-containing protein [Streptomyces sp. NPDC088789]|uniref:DUF3472 domain-containing protein n=1 Tax=Streptomyces sp. NPDC088789 TaxID=3365899 RepID=UPI0037FAA134
MQTRSPRHVRLAVTATLTAALGFVQATAHAAGPGDIPASAPQHFIHLDYTVPKDLSEYTYTVAVSTPAATDDVFYAHYIWGEGDTGYYSGIQPHPNGKAGVRFSYFGPDAKPDSHNCSGGADGDPGVTCAIDDLVYEVGRQYTITTQKTTNADGVTYTGTIKDLTSGDERTIGRWLLPRGFAGFITSGNAFIEKFSGISTCADIPGVSVAYTGIAADQDPVNFTPVTHPATDEAGEDVYTCENVSEYTVTTPANGSYTVESSVPSS